MIGKTIVEIIEQVHKVHLVHKAQLVQQVQAGPQNSIAMAQEYYPEYEENEYYEKGDDQYKNNNYKNAPIANVEKKLFICNNVTDTPNDFECEGFREIFDEGEFNSFPPGPDSGEYIPCNDEICPFIDESDFGVQIFKDVETVANYHLKVPRVNLTSSIIR